MRDEVSKYHVSPQITVLEQDKRLVGWRSLMSLSFDPRDGGFPGGRHGWCYAWSWGVGWCGVGMITFFALAHMVGATQHHVSCTCTHGRCYATSCFLHLHTWSVLRNIMGWGGDDNVLCTCTHGRCYATSCSWHLHTWSVLRNIMFLALAHMIGATKTSCFLHLHTWLVLRNIMFLALAHMVGATQHHVSCTCTHGRCYATSWGGVGMITFFALAHMVGATQHHVPGTCTHGRCYATSCFLHLHTWSVLRNIMGWGGVGVGWGW